jgi:hypothetical protein
MKKVLVIAGLVLMSTLSFGQKSTTVNYTVGVQTLVGTKTNDVANGVSFTAECKPSKEFSYTLGVSANGILNSKDVAAVQFPIMVGTRYHFGEKVSAGFAAGLSLFNVEGTNAYFTWSPSLMFTHKSWGVSALMLSTRVDGQTTSQVGFGLSYKL